MSIPKAFDTDRAGQTLVLMPQGTVSSLAGEDVGSELDQLLEELNSPEVTNVVIDFDRAAYFGTVMLGAMHVIWKRVRDEQGKMALCNLSEMGREILRVSGVDALWPICPSRDEALEEIARPDE